MNGNGNGHGSDDIRFDKRADLLISFAPAPETPVESPSSVQAAADLSDSTTHETSPMQISDVFGEPRTTGSATIIHMSSVLHITRSQPGSGDGGETILSWTSPVVLVEASEAGVKITPVLNTRLLVVAGTLLAAWNFYWLFRTLRERKSS